MMAPSMEPVIEIPIMDNLTLNAPEITPEVGAPAPLKEETTKTDEGQNDSTVATQPEQVNAQEEAPEVSYYAPPPSGIHEPYPRYFDNPQHRKYDYSKPGPGKLPSADFNKKVYEFDE